MPKGPEPYPVRIRGRDYPSVRAAAEALGLNPSTIYTALARGTLDTVGTGTARPHNRNDDKFPPKPVVIGKVRFSSRAAASRALNMSSCYVSKVLSRGSTAQRQNLMRRVLMYEAKQRNSEKCE